VTNVTDDVVEGAQVQLNMMKTQEQQPQQPPQQNVPAGGSTRYGNEGITNQNMQGKQAQQNQKGQGNGQNRQQNQQKRSQSESKP
jgi:hypothetical protein